MNEQRCGAQGKSEEYMTNPESTAIDPVAAMGTDHTEAPAHPLHKVLSFVRRSGRLDDRLQRAWDNYAGTYLLDIAAGNLLDVREGVTLDRAFVESAWGNDNPLIVEIGTGQGENVAAAAAAHPETNFLALEVYDPGVAHTLLLAGKQRLGNLHIAQVNAPELLAATAPGSIAEVWTFFPDPWPKMKHHKRRIVQKAMAGDIKARLNVLGKTGEYAFAVTELSPEASILHISLLHTMEWLTEEEKQLSLRYLMDSVLYHIDEA